MTKIIKHNLHYQEERRTLYLNLANKDDYGRHRGVVLYGLNVEPASATSVRIRPGAVATPFGTKFFFDATNPDDPTINTINLNTLQISGNSIFAAANNNLRPIYVAIIAEVSPVDPSRQPIVESEAQMGASTIRFRARVIATSRATGQSTMNLAPVDPVNMVDLQTPDSDYDPVRTYDEYGGLPTRILTGGTPANESQNRSEVILGYVILGTRADGTPATVLNSGSDWAEGVTFVRAGNAWEQISDFVGHDVLLGRNNVRTFGAPVAASPSLKQLATTFQANGGSASFIPATTPNFGTPTPTGLTNPWDQTWAAYRPPSFMKDGEQLTWQLRRLDYILRLWMDRTGDQTLVNLIQDGAGTDQQWQSPLHRILLRFTGTDTNNLNSMEWSDGTPSGTIVNHLLKSGVAAHDIKGLADVLGTVYGDTHAMALNALNIGILHLLRDVLGMDVSFGRVGIDRAVLRAPGAIARSNPAFDLAGDGPLGDQLVGTTRKELRPTLTGLTATAYLDNESLYPAIEMVARRASEGGQNLLRNRLFQAGDLNSGTTADLPFWSLSAGTWTRTTLVAALDLVKVQFTLPNNASVSQTLTENTNIPTLLSPGTIVSCSVSLKVTAGEVTINVVGRDGVAAEILRAASKVVDVNSRYENVSFSFKITTPTTVASLALVILAGAAGATVDVAGTWMGIGQAPENPAFDPSAHDFLSRDGGSLKQLRGPIYGGGFQAKNFADPTVAQDLVTKAYVDDALDNLVTGGFHLIDTAGAYLWTVPAGVFSVRVVLVGAGGAGGSGGRGVSGEGDDNGGGGGGGGGAAGQEAYFTLDVTPGTDISGILGAGGTPGGINSSGTPQPGANSTLVYGALNVTVQGGLPGTHGTGNITTGGLGGAGGTGPGGPGGNGGKGAPGDTAATAGGVAAGSLGTPGAAGANGTGDATERAGGGGGGGLPPLLGWLLSLSVDTPAGGAGGKGGDGDGGGGLPSTAGAAGTLGAGGGGGGGGGADNGGGGDNNGRAGGPGGDGAVLFAWGV